MEARARVECSRLLVPGPYRKHWPEATAFYVEIYGAEATPTYRSTRASKSIVVNPVNWLGEGWKDVVESLRPGGWMHRAVLDYELHRLTSVAFNKNVAFVESYDESETRPKHQLELMNDTTRGTHYFLALHSRPVVMQQ